MNLIDKYLMPEGKRKKKQVIDKEKSDINKVFRIPTAKGNTYFKDKKKYNRRTKHKIEY